MMAQRNSDVRSSVLKHVTKHLRILAPLLAATALAAVGCGGGSSSTSSSYDGGQAAYSTTNAKPAKAAKPAAASQATRVAIKDSSFQPATIKLHVGDTVTFRNDDEIAHTVTAGDGTFDSGTLQQGAKFTFTAKRAGTIGYVCSFHPGMTGTIEIAR
jgi:plastocyanin